MKEQTVRIRMKGCFQDLENGQEYDLPIERGTWLHGVGLADYVETPEVTDDRI